MNPIDILEATSSRIDATTLWLRGGFPESLLAVNDAHSFQWRRDFIRTYLERDVPQFGPRIPAETLQRLWTMLAHNQGTLLNASRLAASLMISGQTTTRYIDLLVDLLLLRRLSPFHRNTGKRLVKSPKTYVRDSGLVHALLGISGYNAISGHPVAGLSWEGFAVENLIQAAPQRTMAAFYRTAAGAEIDLLLDIPAHGLWAFEIKLGLTAKPEKGFHLACEDLQPTRRILVNAGAGSYPVTSQLEAMGLSEAAAILRSLAA